MLVFLVTVWAAMFVARGTRVGDAIHRMLVEAPARRLSRITRGNLLLAGLILMTVIGVICLLDMEGRMILSMGLPEFAAFAAAVDLSALLDIVVVAVVASSAVRVRTVRAWLGQRIAPRRPRARRPRVQRLRPPANDDEDRRGRTFALAA